MKLKLIYSTSFKFLYSSIFIVGLISCFQLKAQDSSPDTLSVTLADADSTFLRKNLLLLAQKYNIEESKALEVQAKLWNNPSIYVEQNIYNPSSGKYFPVKTGEQGKPATQGENIFQFQQLLLLAGKRNKQVKLNEISTEISEYAFYDLIRGLKFELRNSFFTIYYFQQTFNVYEKEIKSLRNTVGLYEQQYQKGNISLKEVLRLKAFLFDLENEANHLLTEINQRQQDLKVLLGESTPTYINPVVNNFAIDSISIGKLNLIQLIEEAESKRYDLKVKEASARFEQQNLSLQKAMAVPDLKVGAVYDKNGNYIPNYYALDLQMDLPVFNRNQGNIAAAKSKVAASKALLSNYQLQVEKEVQAAYFRAVQNDQLFKNFDGTFPAQFNKLIQGITENYEKRIIGLIEFIDFFEAYKNHVMQFNQLKLDRINAFEEVNYTTGDDIITY